MADERDLSRRTFLSSLGVAVAAPIAGALLSAQEPAAPGPGRRGRGAGAPVPTGPQLPLNTTGLEHLGVNTPDSIRSLKFYSPLFDLKPYREMDTQRYPNRFYVRLGPNDSTKVGYIAIATREGEPTVDHFCALTVNYSAQAARTELEAKGITSGGRGAGGGGGMLRDPDGIQLQLLGVPGGLASTTVPADPIASGTELVKPLALESVVLAVSDLAKSTQHYRIFFGPESAATKDRVTFTIASTRLVLEPAAAGQTPRVARWGVKVNPFDRRAVSDGIVKLGGSIVETGGTDALRFKDPHGLVVEIRA
jgi:hypothetical protein